MRNKRAVQITWVKPTDTSDAEPLSEDISTEMVASAIVAAKEVMQEGAKLIATYLVLDTARKILIAHMTK